MTHNAKNPALSFCGKGPKALRLKALLLLFPACVLLASKSLAASAEHPPPRYGGAITLGTAYDPVGDVRFLGGSGFVLFDYDQIWPHRAPEPLRFKIEGNAGLATAPNANAMISANMLALYYLNKIAKKNFKPYAEAGIGIIYTDFKVKGQGLRFNFNPQIGVGFEWKGKAGHNFFTAVRGHHISNGDLYRENRGVNSVLFMLGMYFD